eukprot:scaffold7544_cov48-Phaeocystis_antarctica.AAC.2
MTLPFTSVTPAASECLSTISCAPGTRGKKPTSLRVTTLTALSGKNDLMSCDSSVPTTPLPTMVKELAAAMRRRSVSKACLRCATVAPSVLMSLWYEDPVQITR